MLVSFNRLFAVLALTVACGTIASPVPSLDAPSSDAAELVDRSTTYKGGRGTYFYPGLGACGWTNKSSDKIVALSHSVFKQSYCGKMISITSRGKTHTAKVVDMCPGCSAASLDMSPSLFQEYADESVGVITLTSWHLE